VYDNIAYGRLEASREEVIEAARAAGAHEFIMKLPSRYDTRIGECGVGLSGGEEQRIALARALLRQPELLVLDEATNALDSFSEHLVQRALAQLRKRCLVLVIAHRMSSVEHADQIVVLDAGRVVEQGSCRELLARDGLFARMYRLQEASSWLA
jgi:subfamily B ATP-binding cassette protein MsbA